MNTTSEYIERKALLKKAKELASGSFSTPLIISAIEDAPKVDVVEVKHGEWYLLKNCANEGVYCSVCTKKVYKTDYANQKIKSPFCPNCGAKMDLKEGAEE
jgi:hypothetical protein